MLEEVDIDGDGTFTFEEFVQIITNYAGITSVTDEEQELRDAFRVNKLRIILSYLYVNVLNDLANILLEWQNMINFFEHPYFVRELAIEMENLLTDWEKSYIVIVS